MLVGFLKPQHLEELVEFLYNVKKVITPEGKLIDRAINNLSKNSKVAKAGWFGERYEDGTPVASVVNENEYGTQRIPARPFIRPTLNDTRSKEQIKRIIDNGLKKALKGRGNISQTLELVGLKFVGDTKEAISKVQSPPLKESTIYNRLHRKADKKTIGSLTKPLVDSGIMLNTMTNKVENE